MRPSLSVVITAFREAETIGPAIEAFLHQLPSEAQILVVCPDPETTAIVDRYADTSPRVHHVADPQQGKPIALNAGLAEAAGDIVVLSDGDVLIDDGALQALLAPFEESTVGAVTGHPISVNARDTITGYWSHLLTDAIHNMRLRRHRDRSFLLCSGYLFAFRRALVDRVPDDALAEDAVISHRIAKQGHAIRYAPDARVYVRYPTTYSDWLRQKVRSAGGYAQSYVRDSSVRMRSAWLELTSGARLAMSYPQNARESIWTLLLFAARLHLWLLVLVKVRLLQRPLDTIWKRVESTK